MGPVIGKVADMVPLVATVISLFANLKNLFAGTVWGTALNVLKWISLALGGIGFGAVAATAAVVGLGAALLYWTKDSRREVEKLKEELDKLGPAADAARSKLSRGGDVRPWYEPVIDAVVYKNTSGPGAVELSGQLAEAKRIADIKSRNENTIAGMRAGDLW